jgi:hypothetical protein
MGQTEMSYLPHLPHVLPASDLARASAKTRAKAGEAHGAAHGAAHEAKHTAQANQPDEADEGDRAPQEAPPGEPLQGKAGAAVGGVGVGGVGKVARAGGDGGEGPYREGRPNICPRVCHGEGGAQSFLSLTSSLSLAGFAGKLARALTYYLRKSMSGYM